MLAKLLFMMLNIYENANNKQVVVILLEPHLSFHFCYCHE